ncbi:MAG: acyl carrier protein [Actinophytocola sp.]|uniref:acyl carrier protein n=1 Tax=Actinophytocola sp. TaxID=1872138 RepID=UPI0013293859|nr:acyl carrier protein [Actinophytocola sp.]MPZ82414.1 acyl carrier protein [Actinophytocola sp.]
MSATVLQRLSGILVGYFGVEADEVRPETTFAELDLDSLAIVEFALVAEKEFGISIGEDEVSPRARVRDALDMLAAKGIRGDA